MGRKRRKSDDDAEFCQWPWRRKIKYMGALTLFSAAVRVILLWCWCCSKTMDGFTGYRMYLKGILIVSLNWLYWMLRWTIGPEDADGEG